MNKVCVFLSFISQFQNSCQVWCLIWWVGPVGVLWLLNINKTDELRDESDDEKVDVNVLNYYLNLKALVLMFGV